METHDHNSVPERPEYLHCWTQDVHGALCWKRAVALTPRGNAVCELHRPYNAQPLPALLGAR